MCPSDLNIRQSCFDLADAGTALKHSRTESRLPLQGTSRRQVLLLQNFFYSWTQFLQSLQPTELLELANIADIFCCQPLV